MKKEVAKIVVPEKKDGGAVPPPMKARNAAALNIVAVTSKDESGSLSHQTNKIVPHDFIG